MSQEPSRAHINSMHLDLSEALNEPRRALERAIKKIDALESDLEAEKTDPPSIFFSNIDDPEAHADWVRRGIRTFADIRDVADQAVRDLVVYALDSSDDNPHRNEPYKGMRPHQLARAARLGPATIYRWRDSGTSEESSPS